MLRVLGIHEMPTRRDMPVNKEAAAWLSAVLTAHEPVIKFAGAHRNLTALEEFKCGDDLQATDLMQKWGTVLKLMVQRPNIVFDYWTGAHELWAAFHNAMKHGLEAPETDCSVQDNGRVLESLLRELHYLDNYASDRNWNVDLCSDGPNTLGFAVDWFNGQGVREFNGGLIFHRDYNDTQSGRGHYGIHT